MQQIGTSEFRRRLSALIAKLWKTNGQVTINGTTTSSSPNITAPSSLVGVEVGMTISGAGIPSGTTVLTVDGVTPEIVMSANATAPHTLEPISFFWATPTAEVHLYAAAFSGGADPLPADFTEATFDTYAALSVGEGSGVYSLPDGTAECDFGDLAWVLTATPTIGNTIYGYWVDYPDPQNASNRVVAMWENFLTPINMSAIGNAVVISVPYTLPDAGSVSQP